MVEAQGAELREISRAAQKSLGSWNQRAISKYALGLADLRQIG